MLHGWLDNLASFYSIIPILSSHRVIALDFPGHGHSEHLPQGMAYHFLDLVYVLQDLVREYQLESFNLLGHSMGGAVSTLFASVSNAVNKLVLVEALGPLTVSVDGTLELMQQSIRDRAELGKKEPPCYQSIEHALSIRSQYSKLSESLVRPIVERGLRNYQSGFTWRSDPRLRTTSINRLTEEQLSPMLRAIDCPVLLIEADKGLFANNTLVQSRKDLIGRLEAILLAGGHHIHMEKPEKTASLINEFLTR